MGRERRKFFSAIKVGSDSHKMLCISLLSRTSYFLDVHTNKFTKNSGRYNSKFCELFDSIFIFCEVRNDSILLYPIIFKMINCLWSRRYL